MSIPGTTASSAAGPVADGLDAHPVAGLDRRFYAFAIDRALVWGVYAVTVWLAWTSLLDHDRTALGVAAIIVVVLAVTLVSAALVGLTGLSPGKALLGLRVVHLGSGTPIGVGPALVRTLILAVATLPTLGIGIATLAWTAVADPRGLRRGWHDLRAHSLVIDVRPRPAEVAEVVSAPRHVVNLTAMRLVPATPMTPVPPTPVPAPGPPERRPTAVAGVASTQPPPEAPASALDDADGDGRTVQRSGPILPPGHWRVSFSDGQSFVVEGLGLIGRGPEARPGETAQHLVALPSRDMSVSKTHAQLHLAAEGLLVVMDRGSTNGSRLVRAGVSKPLGAGRPATLLDGDVVHFGDHQMTVTRES